MCVAIGTSNRFDRHACICKIEKRGKPTIQVYAIWIHASCNFKWRLTNILQLLWPQQKPTFLLRSALIWFDLVRFFLTVDAFVYDSRFLCVPSLLTYRFFFARFFNDTLSTMTTQCFPYQTQLAERECTTCSLLDAAAERKNANLAPNQLCIAIQHKIDKVQSLIRMISWLIHSWKND